MGFVRCCELALLLTLAICCKSTSSQSLLAALFSGNSIITIEKNSSVECTANTVSQCVDCESGIICMEEKGKFTQIAKVTCLRGSNSPYCDPSTGLCTNIVPPKCGSDTFLCPSVNGIYPDPINCTRYHVCGSGRGAVNECPRNNVYDHSTGQCKYRRSNADCVTFNCANREGKTVVYPSDDRIWGKCINGQALILGRCKEYERFDTDQQKCVRVCRTVGNQPSDPFLCQKYIYCGQVGPNQYESQLMECACDQGFDEERRICSSTADCYVKLGKNMCTATLSKRSLAEDDGYESIQSYDEDDAPPFLTIFRPRRESSRRLEFVINNSGNGNAGNEVSNGNDEVQGNLLNGDRNGDNEDSGNVLSRKEILELVPLIINNAGNGNAGNNVANGDDDVDGNLVNGNDNGSNGGSGNVKLSAMIINNSGDRNTGNAVSNGNDDIDGNLVNGNGNGDNTNAGNVQQPRVNQFIINNSGSGNRNNNVSNGDDDVNGNLVNGNGNGDNTNAGNVQRPKVDPFIINNSGNGNTNNKVSNGDDDVNGNLVNGNGNGDNTNAGNVQRPKVDPFIINNSGNGNTNNKVSNGDDDVNGNLVNGNGNGNNTNAGNVQHPRVNQFIINNSGSGNRNNNVSNGNDDVNGNLVNGNGNGDNSNSGNVKEPKLNPFIINNSGDSNVNNTVSNGNDDANGNLVNGNGNGDNDNSGNVNNKPDPRETLLCWLRAIVRYIARLLGQA